MSVESPPSLQRQVSVPGGPAWAAALDPAAPRQVPGAGATGSAASLASSSRPRPPAGKRPPPPSGTGKKPARGAGPGGAWAGAAGPGGEEQVFHYVVERFDDDAADDWVAASPGAATDTPSGKKKGQQEGGPAAAAGERAGTEDGAAVRTPTTDAQHRRIAAERLWNRQRSAGARCTVQPLNRYATHTLRQWRFQAGAGGGTGPTKSWLGPKFSVGLHLTLWSIDSQKND